MASRRLSSGRRAGSSRSASTTASNIGGTIAPSADVDPRATTINVVANQLVVELADGRRLSASLEQFPRLRTASVSERRHYEIIGGGTLIHWPDIDEDIDVAAFVSRDRSSPRA